MWSEGIFTSLAGIEAPPPLPDRTPEIRRPRNFYRRMVRRKLSWLGVFVLSAFWLAGIYEGYFGENADDLPADAVELALLNCDRGLRVNDALATRPAAVQWLMYGESPREWRRSAKEGLAALEAEGVLDEEGECVLGLLRGEAGESVDPESIPWPLYRAVIGGETPEPEKVEALAAKMRDREGRWWDAEIARRILERGDGNDGLREALAVQEGLDGKLFRRVAVSNGVFWFVGAAGLFFVPGAFRRLRAGWKAAGSFKPVRYHSRWEPTLILTVFLGADLLAGQFLSGAYFVTAGSGTGFYFDVWVDTVWRFLPPVLAAAVLFAKPRHAVRAFGMNRWPEWRIVLAVFAVLVWLDYGLYQIMKPFAPNDPTGGLDAMEAGWRGLFYGLLSACVAAPVAEEMFYRGLLLRGLEKRFGLPIAAVCVTGSFALVHFYDLYGFVSVGIFGLSALVVYRATGSLITAIALHALYNLSITVPMWFFYHSRL